ncbi:MAG: zinc-dependent peptidase [Pseudomonadota bacterium]|jgi:Mlc titration factor MtfA (ptsG expression regulator)|nr:zinc-dependent peptidase [Xanthomonadaceae bacterium]MDE2248306.1 zinc-dependent peptidase [Xanthomonadaceae bacterium]MDE3209642.1 zinc-dependent peptidase [Pseudomonadota bacterium]
MQWPKWQSLRTRPEPVPDRLWRRALSACPLARRLDPERQHRLRQLATLFLTRKHFHALAGAVLDDYWRLLIAMQACLPALQRGAASLRGWSEVLVYPGELKVRLGHQHECTGVVAENDEALAGDAWQHGPLVLSLADVQLDLEQPWDGYNVVVHEMAHKLDLLAGPPAGVPPLGDIPRRHWIERFQTAYDRLAGAAPGDDAIPINPHAADGAGEYFAVVSELHYSRPALLREVEPEVAGLLQTYYGPSPADAGEPVNVCLPR